MIKPKLLYILPEYNIETPTHFLHIFEMLEELAEFLDIFLLVEKGDYPRIRNLKGAYVQKLSAPPLNLVERFCVILVARLKGFPQAYVHYSYWGAILASLVFRLTAGKVFYWHCEVYDQFFSKLDWKWSTLKKKFLDEWLMVLTLKLVNFLVTGAPTVANFYQNQFNLPSSKIKIIPNCINLSRFQVDESRNSVRKRLGLPQDKTIIFFAHRLAPRKGADLLPDIVRSVSQKSKNTFFLIVGDGPLSTNLKLKIKNLKLSSYVRFEGMIPNTKTLYYYAASDLFIMPSRQEGFPRVLLEAMATGTPFIATDVGGTRDILTSTQRKWLIEKGDIKAFSDAVLKLLEDKKSMALLSIEGQRQVMKFDRNIVVKQFVKLFQE